MIITKLYKSFHIKHWWPIDKAIPCLLHQYPRKSGWTRQQLDQWILINVRLLSPFCTLLRSYASWIKFLVLTFNFHVAIHPMRWNVLWIGFPAPGGASRQPADPTNQQARAWGCFMSSRVHLQVSCFYLLWAPLGFPSVKLLDRPGSQSLHP